MFQEITNQDVRCVFKKDDKFYKVYLGDDDRTGDFQREYFVSKTLGTHHSNGKDRIVQTTDGFYNMNDKDFDELKTIGECGKKIEAQPPAIPMLVTRDIGGEDLSDWLKKQNDAISKELIRNFAFQLVWIIGEMHSQFGIQHNDIQETNIRVREVTTQKTIRYKCKNDVFEITLKPKHLEVLLIDFGSSTLKKTNKYPKKSDGEPWEYADVAFLKINNCPEYYFNGLTIRDLRVNRRNSECDLFMIGHVLLSMHLHKSNFQDFAYEKYGGVHVYDLKNDITKMTSLKVSDLSNLVDDLFGKNDPLYTQSETDDPKSAEIFLLNLIALSASIQGYDKTMEYLSQITDEQVLAFYTKITTDASYQNYVKTRFSGLINFCGDNTSQSFIQRIMQFDPVKRRGILNYSLTGNLFHPYFGTFYKGKSETGAVDQTYTIPFFAPPFEYSDTQKESHASILQSIETHEKTINDDMGPKIEDFTNNYFPKLDKTTSSGRFLTITKVSEIEGLTDVQFSRIKENYITNKIAADVLKAIGKKLRLSFTKGITKDAIRQTIIAKLKEGESATPPVVAPATSPKKATPAADAEKLTVVDDKTEAKKIILTNTLSLVGLMEDLVAKKDELYQWLNTPKTLTTDIFAKKMAEILYNIAMVYNQAEKIRTNQLDYFLKINSQDMLVQIVFTNIKTVGDKGYVYVDSLNNDKNLDELKKKFVFLSLNNSKRFFNNSTGLVSESLAGYLINIALPLLVGENHTILKKTKIMETEDTTKLLVRGSHFESLQEIKQFLEELKI